MRVLTWCLVTLCLAMPAVSSAAVTNTDLLARIASRIPPLQQNAARVAKLTTSEEMLDYITRLQDDTERLNITATPYGFTAQTWSDTAQTVAALDISLADQLIASKRAPVDAVPGVQARFVISSADGSWQPVTIFIPKSYGNGPTPMVVLLHGHPQWETEILGASILRDLAEQTGTIVVAPYGRGYYDFHGVAIQDVDDAMAAAESALHVDKNRVYLAGYSMGGFSVFEVGVHRAKDWHGILCISGALLGHDASTVVSTMWQMPYYFVTGMDDESIPTAFTQTSAAYLESRGLAVSLYVEPKGRHRLTTLQPSVDTAWRDMLKGVQHGVAQTVQPLASGLNQIQMPSSVKP